MQFRQLVCLTALIAASVTACGKDDTGDAQRVALTQRQKDSILAQSRIPGARAVKRALINTDSAAARQARLDSALREP
jgi:hypothetical protein